MSVLIPEYSLLGTCEQFLVQNDKIFVLVSGLSGLG